MPDWVQSVETLSRALSIAAIPVILAAGGWIIQRTLQKQTVGAAYVNLAVTILENPDKSKVPNELREWAVDLLNDNSPTKLNRKAIDSLKSGDVTLPASSFNFIPSPALSQDVKAQIETSLNRFRTYFASLGFVGDARTISVSITPGTVVKTKEGSGVALWLPDTNTMAVASDFANDQPTVLRQLAHPLIDLKVDAAWTNYWAIESGLATYFPCSFVGEAALGSHASDAGKRVLPPQNLHAQRKFNEINLRDWISIQNDGSEIWGAVLWQIREIIGQSQADKMITAAWRDLLAQKPENALAYSVFGTNLVNRSSAIDGKYAAPVRAALEQRGLRF